jgi:hypothetical protein
MLSIQTKAAAEKPFLILPDAGGEALSYAEFNARVHQTAHLLHSDLGLRRSDPLGVIGAVDADLLVIVCAAWVVGLTVYPLRPGRPPPEACRVVIAQAKFFDPALAPTVIQIGDSPRGGVPDFRELVRGLPNTFYTDEAEPTLDDVALAAARQAADEASLVPTESALGGENHLVSMRSLLNGALRLALAQGSLGGPRVTGTVALDDLASLSAVILTPLLTGGTVTLLTAFEPGTFWRRAAADRIQSAYLTPVQVEACTAYARVGHAAGRPIFGAGIYQQDVRGFRHVLSTGLTRQQAAGFCEIYGLPILHGYCDDTLGGFVCLLPIDLDWAAQQRWLRGTSQPSVGVALAGVEVESPPPGQRGTIRFRVDGVETRVAGTCDVDSAGRRYYFIEREGRP